MYPIECMNVWKKYRKGEKIYSLRDFIPHMAKRILSRNPLDEELLQKEEFWAIKDVSFRVEKGEVVGIIGPNGAGKSTILKLLSKIIKPTKGDFAIQGRLSALLEITAGFHQDFTGRENVYFNGAILGMTKKEIDRKFDQIVGFSGVGEFIDTPVKRYSSGMYARLGFALAAHLDPDVLLVDEVLAVGDLTFQAKCAQKMRELLKSGTTIVLVSHNIPLVQNICQRVILLNHGEVLKQGLPDEVIPYYQNIVHQQSEEELKRRLGTSQDLVEVKGEDEVKIKSVELTNELRQRREVFAPSESLRVGLTYEVSSVISHPAIIVNVYRADGVLCCSANNIEQNHPIKQLDRQGNLEVIFKDLALMPGIYHIEMTIWDQEMIHPYAMSPKIIFRVQSEGYAGNSQSVFWAKVAWGGF